MFKKTILALLKLHTKVFDFFSKTFPQEKGTKIIKFQGAFPVDHEIMKIIGSSVEDLRFLKILRA